ncbi:hypothetical protein NQ315_009065, partial [Exocentrus adspersus]
CAERYRIPRETLRNHLKGRRGKNGPTVGGGGRPTALSVAAENELAECVRTMAKWGFGLNRTEVMDLVETLVAVIQEETAFVQKTIRKSEPLEHNRNTQTNPFIIYGFFDLLEATITEIDLADEPQ